MHAFDATTTGAREARIVEALNARWHGKNVDPPKLAFPIKLQIQTQSWCQASCVMCPYPETAKEVPMGRMSETLFEKIMAEAGRHPVERISLYLHNEPLLDKRLPDLVATAARLVPHAVRTLFSNGELLHLDTLRSLVAAGLNEINLSINGGDRETYERTNRGLHWDRVLGNLDALLAAKSRGELPRLEVKIVAVDAEGVPPSVANLARRWPAHAARIFIKPVTNRAGNVAPRRHAPGSAGSDNLPRRPRPCQRPFVKAYIVWNGDVILCNCDWRREVVLGNLEHSSLEEIWRNAAYEALRKRHLTGDLAAGSICSRCDYPLLAAEDE